MKRERVKELLNELIEREFTVEEMAELFGDVRNYLNEKKAAERTADKTYEKSIPMYRKWLQQTLDSLGLNYTIEEFEEDF